MRIGLFDSGIGGLTVLKTLIDKYPKNDYIYYGDTLNVPYGNKEKNEILKLSKKSIDFLIAKQVELIIIACGTISANCLKELREYTNIPIYDVLTPTIEYLNNSKYKNIGLIATKATVKSHIFKNNINKNIYEIATPELVTLIESNRLDNIKEILLYYLEKYLNKIDILVLGCTHYPTLIPYLKEILPSNIKLLDMSKQIVICNQGNSIREIYFTSIDDMVIRNTKTILNNNYDIKEL